MDNPFLEPPGIRSLNRVRVMALEGVQLPPQLQAMRAYPALAGQLVVDQIAAAAPSIGLDAASPTLIADFYAQLEGEAAAPAVAIAAAFGRKLGYLLLTLKRGEAANRQARPDWQSLHWDYWSRVRQVIVGGGIMRGRFGAIAIEQAKQLLAEHECADLDVRCSPFGGSIGLVGVARLAPKRVERMLLFDFGQTSVKVGVAKYVGAQLIAVTALAAWPSGCGALERLPQGNPTEAEARWQGMDRIMRRYQPLLGDRGAIGVSLATYLRNGVPPLESRGCYAVLSHLGESVAARIADAFAQLGDYRPPVVVTEDGSAAATAHADAHGAVVITLGTALGVGFCGEQRSLRSLATSFRVDTAEAE